jgi:hypothetical protein
MRPGPPAETQRDRTVKLALVLAFVVVSVVLLIYFVKAEQRARCQSGEDPEMEREFEAGLRINCSERLDQPLDRR